MNGKAKLYIKCTGSTGSSNVIHLKGSYYYYFYLSKEEDETEKSKRLVKCGPDPYPGNFLFPSLQLGKIYLKQMEKKKKTSWNSLQLNHCGPRDLCF